MGLRAREASQRTDALAVVRSPVQHDVLRHTRLALMVEGGVPLVVVSKHARHEKVLITVQFYVHSEVGDTKRAAEDSFDRLLASG